MRKDLKLTCIFPGSKYIKGLTDGEMVEWFKAAVLKTAEAQASASSNLALSAIFFLQKKWRNEDVSLLFTVRSTTSLKRRSLFFTSSLNSREDLLVKSLPLVTCEDVSLTLHL